MIVVQSSEQSIITRMIQNQPANQTDQPINQRNEIN